MVKVREDLTGRRFGRLTVIKQAEDYVEPFSGRRHAQWLCECSCEEHTLVVVKQTSLKKKNPTQSCGCLQKEITRSVLHKINSYSTKLSDEYGEYYIGYTNNTNNKFYVDAEDFSKIQDLCWTEVISGNGLHQLTTTINKKNVPMHIFLGFKRYDHIDRNQLNNRRYNLRQCSQQENNRNKSIRSDNKTGVTGVHFDKKYKKWMAELSCGNFKFRKLYDNFDDAVRARLEAEKKYFGEFAPQQHLYEQYNITI